MKKVFVTTSWDDGHVLDMKLGGLLNKYGIKATIYISPRDREISYENMLNDEQIKKLSESFEIGAHTMTHPRLPEVSLDEARREVKESKEYLEKITGKPVYSFCYPCGAYQKEHSLLAEELGFKVARTVSRFSLSPVSKPFEMKTSIHTYDHYSDIFQVMKFAKFNPFKFLNYFLHWDRQAIAMFDQVLKNGGVFHLWGHSWEVEGHNDWERLEKVLAYIANRPGVEYVVNSQLV